MTRTFEIITALRREAGEAGDLEQVAICDRALTGDRDALAECHRVIGDARAREDTSRCETCGHAIEPAESLSADQAEAWDRLWADLKRRYDWAPRCERCRTGATA